MWYLCPYFNEVKFQAKLLRPISQRCSTQTSTPSSQQSMVLLLLAGLSPSSKALQMLAQWQSSKFSWMHGRLELQPSARCHKLNGSSGMTRTFNKYCGWMELTMNQTTWVCLLCPTTMHASHYHPSVQASATQPTTASEPSTGTSEFQLVSSQPVPQHHHRPFDDSTNTVSRMGGGLITVTKKPRKICSDKGKRELKENCQLILNTIFS